jgi:hypothetical protein
MGMSEEWLRVTSQQYLDANDDVRNGKADPLRHALSRVIDLGEPRCLKYPAALDTPEGKAAYWKAWKDVADAKMDPLKHYIRHGWREPRWPLPGTVVIPPTPPTPPTPSPSGEIIRFDAIPALDDPDNCYFTGCKVNGKMWFCTYKDGSYTSYLKDITGKELARFNAESGFMIIAFKGKYYMSQEHGDYPKTDRGRILQLQVDGSWRPVYTHPRWHLITEMHVHGDYLYATGCRWDDDSDPAGIIRTIDGTNWELYNESKNEYRFWGMTSEGGNLIVASTSSGADWGKNNCRPTVWRNRDMIWTDYDHPMSGFWAAEYWPKVKDTFLGRCGDGAVVRLSDHKEVLTMSGCDAIHDLLIDKKTDTLMAFCNRPGNGGCIVKGTKTGNPGDWYTVDEGFSVPSIIDGYYDDETGDVYLMTGLFAGRGRVYKSVRKAA